jgi:hypothetical protein
LRLRALALVPVLGAVLAGPAQAGVPIVDYSVSGAVGDNGWYVSNVTLRWSVNFNGANVTDASTCPPATLVPGDTSPAGTTRRCDVYVDNPPILAVSVTAGPFRIDTTKPTVTAASSARAPDRNGWFNHAVGVTWSGADASSGVASCSAATFAGPDSATASVSGTCRDNAGNLSAALALPLKYDATPPQVTGANPNRPPDFQSFFVSPVTLGFTGTDATSGLDSCDQVTYAGPDGAQAGVPGSCTDKAGNVGTGAIPIAYDATTPTLTPKAAAGDTVTTLTWKTSADTQSVQITRKPGPKAPIYQGGAAKFEDRRVRNGTRYKYTLTATDEAGHTTTRSLTARPTAWLISPKPFARLKAPPWLRWKRVKRAHYYNVQVYRVLRDKKGKTIRRKVLSSWPVSPRLRLHSAWRYNGHWHRLAPGAYLWYVWPGYGERSQRRYGRLRGVRTFTIV